MLMEKDLLSINDLTAEEIKALLHACTPQNQDSFKPTQAYHRPNTLKKTIIRIINQNPFPFLTTISIETFKHFKKHA